MKQGKDGKSEDGRCRCAEGSKPHSPAQRMSSNLRGCLLTVIAAIVAALVGYNLAGILLAFWRA